MNDGDGAQKPNQNGAKSAPQNSAEKSDAAKPYLDPDGRHVTLRHKRLALRQLRQMGLSAENGDEALQILYDKGVDILTLAPKNPDKNKKAGGADTTGTSDKSGPKSDGKTDDDSILDEEQMLLSDDDDSLPVPQKKNNAPTKPDRAEILKAERNVEVARIQRELVGRRRKRMLAMLLRLIILVFLPTAAFAYYYWNIATDMYETSSAFVIQKSDSVSGGGGLEGILAGTGFANSQDSIVVQDYLQSRQAFNRLEADYNFSAHFKNPDIDQVQRLPADATLDDAYALYQNNTTIGYDPTEGLIRMTIIATDPATSQAFSEALVSYAEERVDGLTLEARGDQLRDAEERYRISEQKRLAAQQRVLELQQQRGVLSADVELQLQMTIINELELKAETQRLSLAELLDNPSPRQSQVEVLQREIARLEQRIAERRSDLTEASEGTISLARIGAELMAAENELATRQLLEQESLSALEASRLEADRQSRYLSMAYDPIAPAEATYPKKLESTVLAFLVFSGIYILLSLTYSILREQISV